MVDIRISDLPATGSFTGTEQVPVVQAGTTKRATLGTAALEAYEEGVWTPTLYGTTTAGTTTYTKQEGNYIRIGKFVHALCRIAWSNTTGVGQARVGGLPVNIKSGTLNRAAINMAYYHSILLPAGKILGGFGEPAQSFIRLTNVDNTTMSDLTDMAQLSPTGELYINISYLAE